MEDHGVATVRTNRRPADRHRAAGHGRLRARLVHGGVGSLLGLLLLAMNAVSARAADPVGVVQDFCRADGAGARLHPRTWYAISHLVAWPLEPAWDRVLLIGGYQITGARPDGDGVAVDVVYTVTADVLPGRIVSEERLETHTFQLLADENATRWRVAGPPGPPAVFQNQIDAQAIADSLNPESATFLSNSLFIWQMLSRSGWTLPYLETRDLIEASLLAEASEPQPGDLVFYLMNDQPYHVGFLLPADTVVSATLSAGIWQAPVDAFPGKRRVLRLAGNQSSATSTAKATAPTTPRTEPGAGNTPAPPARLSGPGNRR